MSDPNGSWSGRLTRLLAGALGGEPNWLAERQSDPPKAGTEDDQRETLLGPPDAELDEPGEHSVRRE